ncbi:MAG: glycosyl transferase family 90 [Pricia sp.]
MGILLDNYLMNPDDINAYYYAKNFIKNALPKAFFKRKFKNILAFEAQCDQEELYRRLDYYLRLDRKFELPSGAVAIKDFKRTKGTAYYLDLKEFLHYFSKDTAFAYHFGDELHVNPHPTLFKARPLIDKNSNSVLFKFNKRRHFRWMKDPIPFENKKDMLVWRGGVHQPWRRDFLEKFCEHPKCNVGHTNTRKNLNEPRRKEFLSIPEQLRYKFIACIEGNDVATNLKWAMSSNSLCIMPKPTCETWYMEGTLRAGVHYVEVARDFSDLEEKMEYYVARPKEAEAIIDQAHRHVQRFQDKRMEELLCFMVLEKYAKLSGQSETLRFL